MVVSGSVELSGEDDLNKGYGVVSYPMNLQERRETQINTGTRVSSLQPFTAVVTHTHAHTLPVGYSGGCMHPGHGHMSYDYLQENTTKEVRDWK